MYLLKATYIGEEDSLKRVNVIDTARGMLILYIVFFVHGLFFLDLIPQWISSLLLFEMPAMFIISGYAYHLYESSRFGQKTDTLSARAYVSFLASRFTRIFVPYVIYATFCVAVLYFISSLGKGPNYSLRAMFFAWLNPITFGRNFSIGMLNWHLWFIPVFLIVTAAMPIATKLRPFNNPDLLTLVIGIAIFEFAFTRAHFPFEDLIRQVVFYLIFSLLGYYVAHSPEYFRRANIGGIAAVSAILLASIAILSGNIGVLNMQVNKFPPNYIFFLFSCLWISLFLYLSFRAPGVAAKFERCGNTIWLRPFIRSGYSIYLWQGVGYTAATQVGKMINIPILAVWPLALGISIGLGLLASPAEKVRFRL